MSIITLDMETYYSDSYSLSKLTTEEYIRDPQFQVIGVGIKLNDGETVWVSGTHEEIKKHLDTYDWANSALLCHNTIFDGAILSFIFGIVPYIYLDTLCMARAIHGVDAGGSLKALAEHYRIGVKGEEVVHAKGKRREDFTKEELERYGEYCQNDVFLTYLLYTILATDFPLEELKLIDMTIRMFTQPVFEVNDAMLVDRLEEIRAEKLELLGALMDRLECKDEEEVRKKLSSNKQFAELLEELGIDPPKKISPTTGKKTYALAKNDVGFIELSEHEDPFIQQLCAVRLGTKSTIEESRIERFIDVGARNKGKLPIPLKYYGAHTGRWCLTGDHEVLTPQGWVRIDTWDGQPIRQWDSETKHISWATNPAWVKFPYEGHLIQFDGAYHKAVYTEEHRVPCLARHTTEKVVDITAGKLATLKSRAMFVSGYAEGRCTADADKLRLIVAMHADGYNIKDNKNNMVRFRFTKTRKVNRLEELLTKNRIPYYKKTNPSEPDITVIIIRGADAPDWLREAKTLPEWFYALGAYEADVIIQELAHWDGCVTSKNSIQWSGKDYNAAIIYSTLAHTCGYRAKTNKVDPRKENWSAIYKVNITPAVTVREKQIKASVSPHKGYVYCFEVPTRYFMCRYKDTIFITGNSGSDKVNFQNLPSRDKKKKALKNSVVAPDGYTVINSDSSQIEARVLVWLVGQDDVVEQFANGEDVYSIFASKALNMAVSKATPVERFVGKTCIAEGSLVLTDKGLVPIEEITVEHRVWDGVEWVIHEGLIYQGEKDVITYQGLTATEDHGVFTERGPVPFGVAASRMEDIVRTGNGGEAVRISGDYFLRDTAPEEEHLCVRKMYELWRREVDTEGQSSKRGFKGLPIVQSKEVYSFGSIGEAVRCYISEMYQRGLFGLQALRSAWNKVPVQISYAFYTVGGEKLAPRGLPWGGNRQNRHKWGLRSGQSKVGFSRSTSEKPQNHCQDTMEREGSTTSGVSLSLQILMDLQTSDKKHDDRGTNTRKVRVYDILNAGPRRRFTADGVLVLNCVLGLGYGTGAEKLRHTLKTQPPGADLSELVCKGLVGTYRSVNHKVVDFWGECDRALSDLASWPRGKKPYTIGKHEAVWITPDGIKLPNGLYIRYPQLKWDTSGAKGRFVYKSRKGPVSIWGGAMTENIVQALARIIVGEQMLNINDRYRVVLTVHDSVVTVVHESEVDHAREYIESCMRVAPAWATGLPVTCESGFGKSYGDT